METPFFRIKKKQKYMTLTYTERLSMIIESYILYNTILYNNKKKTEVVW